MGVDGSILRSDTTAACNDAAASHTGSGFGVAAGRAPTQPASMAPSASVASKTFARFIGLLLRRSLSDYLDQVPGAIDQVLDLDVLVRSVLLGHARGQCHARDAGRVVDV